MHIGVRHACETLGIAAHGGLAHDDANALRAQRRDHRPRKHLAAASGERVMDDEQPPRPRHRSTL
jgi:hypothetical protein